MTARDEEAGADGRPNRALLDGSTPSITLAGMSWPVPLFAVRQNRIVAPALRRIFAIDLTRLTAEEVDLLADSVFVALTRAHPGLTRAQFDLLPITVPELTGAIGVLARQTGLYEPKRTEAAPGEETAGNLPTGTE